ncbi:hypothetical protein EIP91_001885 [Steccherinum ochraceum]|uniref:F-box domain-containing protein n=1 Tax=Steccherinum ochraceum TaxID=92696 RepID=A0A4R0RFG8_9APHY|nr:hypothetical protein EIP91_001885 [Steccherinum ochraceum]
MLVKTITYLDDLTVHSGSISAPCRCKSVSETLLLSTREEIEKEIAGHVALVVHLRRRLNTLAPIDDLPAELLAQIFRHFIRAVSTQTNFPQRLLACVCRKWNEVVHGTPGLWTQVYMTSYPSLRRHRFLSQLLEKSEDVPLMVWVDDGLIFQDLRYQTSSNPRFSMRLIAQHIDRVTVLHLAQRHEDIESSLSLLPQMAPRLIALKVAALVAQRTISGALAGPRGVRSMRVAIPSIYSSQLRELVLENCQLPWVSKVLPRSLTHLSIVTDVHHGRLEGEATVTYDDIMKVLATLSQLSHLHLRCHLPVASPDANTTQAVRTVTLPRLESLHIDDQAPTCLYLLQHLIISPSATVNSSLKSFLQTHIPELTSWVVSRIRAEQHDLSLPTPSTLLIGDGRVQMVRSKDDGEYRGPNYWTDSDFAIRVLGSSFEQSVSTWFLRDVFPRILDWVRNVTTLYICDSGCFGSHDGFPFNPEREALWRTVLHSMPNITRLALSTDIRLPALLAECADGGQCASVDGTSSLASRFLLPKLSAVKMEIFPFVPEPKPEQMRLRTSVLDWRDTLRTRKAAGCPDISMILAYCPNVVEEHLAMLREVAEVEHITGR